MAEASATAAESAALLLSEDMEEEEEEVHCEVHREGPLEEVHREAQGEQRGGGTNELH